MLEIDIPGGELLQLSHLVLDYNGTLAVDGELLPGVADQLKRLTELLQIYVITADTHGTVREKLKGLPCAVHIIDSSDQDRQKEAFVQSLGAQKVVAVGNGRNDGRMLNIASLGFGLIQEEGASLAAILNADIVCTDILHAFDLLLHPARLKATLRN